jgi:hypothetical protein
MKKAIALIATLALFGAVFAQADYADNSGGGNTATLNQTVNISIPNRVALHLTSTSLALDLNSLGDSIGEETGVFCTLVRKDRMDDIDSYASFIAAMGGQDNIRAVYTYPAAVIENGQVQREGGEYLKGGLACSHDFIIQKFSNYLSGWHLTADVNIPTHSGIKYAIIDHVYNDPLVNDPWVADGDTSVCRIWFLKCLLRDGVYSHYVDETKGLLGNRLELDDVSLARERPGRTNGWLDDHITQWFYFDGSEIAGDHRVEVQFTLTGGL